MAYAAHPDQSAGNKSNLSSDEDDGLDVISLQEGAVDSTGAAALRPVLNVGHVCSPPHFRLPGVELGEGQLTDLILSQLRFLGGQIAELPIVSAKIDKVLHLLEKISKLPEVAESFVSNIDELMPHGSRRVRDNSEQRESAGKVHLGRRKGKSTNAETVTGRQGMGLQAGPTAPAAAAAAPAAPAAEAAPEQPPGSQAEEVAEAPLVGKSFTAPHESPGNVLPGQPQLSPRVEIQKKVATAPEMAVPSKAASSVVRATTPGPEASQAKRQAGKMQGVVPLETNRSQRNLELMSQSRHPPICGHTKTSTPAVQGRVRSNLKSVTEDAVSDARVGAPSQSLRALLTEEAEDWRGLETLFPATARAGKRLWTAAALMASRSFHKVFSAADGVLLHVALLQQSSGSLRSRCLSGASALALLLLLASAVWLVGGFSSEAEVLWTERLLASAVLVTLPLAAWSARHHRHFRKHLRAFGTVAQFSDKWDKKTAWSAFVALLVWLLAVGCKFDVLYQSAQRAPIEIAIFAGTSSGLLVVIHGIVTSCSGLVLFIDSYCHSIEQKEPEIATDDWNVIQATIRNFAETLQGMFTVLFAALLVGCMAVVVDARSQRSEVDVRDLIPVIILLASILRIAILASLVTEKCMKVHSYVNSLGGLDTRRQQLVEYIFKSGAAFYIFEFRFTGTVGWRLIYTCATAAFLSDRLYAAISTTLVVRGF